MFAFVFLRFAFLTSYAILQDLTPFVFFAFLRSYAILQDLTPFVCFSFVCFCAPVVLRTFAFPPH